MTATGESPGVIRFDTAAGRSFSLAGRERVLSAHRPAGVGEVLERAEEAARAGRYVAGFLAYEAAPAFDPALAVHPPPGSFPLASLAVCESQVDIAEPRGAGPYELGEWAPALGRDAYLQKAARIRALIEAGDTYQVNLTFPLRAAFRGDPLGLYLALLDRQRAGYSAFIDLGRFAVLSLSPELFFEWREGILRMRPMKGTRRRGRWRSEDEALQASLSASEKDRAENLMIVDMLRNDAGRVAEPGSVEVTRLFEIERYPTVHQMTSTIEARTAPGTGIGDVLGALFPCGSVTGAPKVRTMEIIRELEDGPRGVYCGAVGFIGPGETVFNVPIRTLVVDRERGEATMGVGSGVVFDSRPDEEYEECLAKAAFTLRTPPRDHALLETMRWEPGGGVRLLERHLARMGWSAERLGYRFDAAAARQAVDRETPEEESVLRLLLDAEGRLRIERGPVPENPPLLRLALCTEPVVTSDPRLYHKTTERQPYERRRATRPDAHDVVLVNERGEVTEATRFNLIARIGGECLTPPVGSGLLPGVMRETLLARGEVRERRLTPADLRNAEGIWAVNAVRGRCPAILVP